MIGIQERDKTLEIKELFGYCFTPLISSNHIHQIANRAHIGVFTLLYDLMQIFVYPIPFVVKKEVNYV